MKKKLVSLLLVTAMSVTALAGCGSKADGTEGSKKEDKKEAQSITFMAPDWAVPTDEQLDEFTKETGIEVVIALLAGAYMMFRPSYGSHS